MVVSVFFVVRLRPSRPRAAMLNACSAASKKASLSCAVRLPSCKAFISNNRLIDWLVIWAWMPRPLPGSTSDCGWCFFIRQNWKALSSRVRLRWMSLTLGVHGRVKEAEVREAKASSLACWSAMAGSIPRWWSRSRRRPLLTHIENHTRKGSVYYTDAFRGYQSLQRFGKHLVVNHSKEFVNKRTKNHINGIEGFWSYAKHILYNYRGVSRYYFPMYLKEIEYRYNHRKENVFKLFLQLYFGYVSP